MGFTFGLKTEKNSKTWVVNLNSGHGYWFDERKKQMQFMFYVLKINNIRGFPSPSNITQNQISLS